MPALEYEQLSACQQKVADQFMDFMVNPDARYFVLRGHAGTGKSTMTEYLIDMVKKQSKLVSLLMGNEGDTPIHVTATTNKAARVIADMTGAEPKTIHSLLGLQVYDNYKTGKTNLRKTKDYQVVADSLLIIDEASFIDTKLLKMIEESTVNCKTLFIGDPYQLAPVFEAESPVFKADYSTGTLETIMRNEGPIAKLAGKFREAVKTGQFDMNVQIDGKSVVYAATGQEFQQLVDAEFGRDDFKAEDAKVVAWTNNRVHQYNAHIQRLRGEGDIKAGDVLVSNKPAGKGKISTDQIVTVASVGDPEERMGISGRIVTIGIVRGFLPDDQQEAAALMKRYGAVKDWENYFTIKNDWLDLRPLYACTGHKSQGSTYRKAFIDLDDISRCSVDSDMARLLYVAISRAKEQVVLHGKIRSNVCQSTAG